MLLSQKSALLESSEQLRHSNAKLEESCVRLQEMYEDMRQASEKYKAEQQSLSLQLSAQMLKRTDILNNNLEMAKQLGQLHKENQRLQEYMERQLEMLDRSGFDAPTEPRRLVG